MPKATEPDKKVTEKAPAPAKRAQESEHESDYDDMPNIHPTFSWARLCRMPGQRFFCIQPIKKATDKAPAQRAQKSDDTDDDGRP